jgi:glutamate decarboxylase
MVHLAQVPKDKHINAPLVPGMEKLSMRASSQADAFTTSVYGSRFAAEDLPKHEMPETEMPKEVSLSPCSISHQSRDRHVRSRATAASLKNYA